MKAELLYDDVQAENRMGNVALARGVGLGKGDLLPALSLFLFLVLLGALVMHLSQRPPEPLPASAPLSEFSAERACRHVEALGQETHPVGTVAHAPIS